MKFRFLLWMLARMLVKAGKTNPQVQQQLAGKQLDFSLLTLDGRVARSFQIAHGRISSRSGTVPAPAFTMGFRDAALGYEVMTAKNKQLAFMQGIQNKDIRIEGDTAQVVWFQGLLKLALSKKKQSADKAK